MIARRRTEFRSSIIIEEEEMEDHHVSRRQVLTAALASGAVGTVMGTSVVFAKHQRQLGPFSDWSEPVNLGPVVNSASNDFDPGISKDGLSLYFTSDRPGGVNGANLIPVTEVWVAQREELDAPWGPPRNLGPQINIFGYSTGVPNLTPNVTGSSSEAAVQVVAGRPRPLATAIFGRRDRKMKRTRTTSAGSLP